MRWLFILLAILAGALMPVQAGINTELKRLVQEPVWAAFISFGVGTVSLLGLGLALGLSPLTLAAALKAPAWVWTGGLLGAFFVIMSVILTSHLGAASMFAFIIAGQLAASLLLDHLGLLGYAVREASAPRILGICLLFAGALLVQKY